MWKKILKRSGWVLSVVVFLMLLLFLVRRPVMRFAGSLLIEEDNPTKCDALFILSGGPVDRSAEAYRLYRAGFAPYVICTGETVPSLFEVMDLNITESALTRKALNKLGMPDSLIKEVQTGTSTREEANVVLNYCRSKGIKKVMVVSDKFHTLRVNQVFRSRLEKAGITMVLRGAPSSRYSEDFWWAGESGLLMVNNEYIKLSYYFLAGLTR